MRGKQKGRGIAGVPVGPNTRTHTHTLISGCCWQLNELSLQLKATVRASLL